MKQKKSWRSLIPELAEPSSKACFPTTNLEAKLAVEKPQCNNSLLSTTNHDYGAGMQRSARQKQKIV